MNIPDWLADIFAAIMLATALYCAGRLVVARIRRRRIEHDSDIVHLLMGVAMAGMLIPALDPVNGTVWEVVFTATTLWFLGRVALVLRAGDPDRRSFRHHVPHLVLSGAMLYMYLATSGLTGTAGASGSGGGMGGMGGMGGAGAAAVVRYPTVALVLALFLCGFAVTVVDRTPLLAAESVNLPDAGGSSTGSGPRCHSAGDLLAPRGANCCDIAMSVTMAFLLITLV